MCGPAHVRGRPDGREQVLDHGPMQHLLPGDSEDHPAPAFDGLKLILAKTGTRCALEAERGIQVLTHQAMLKLSSLAQKIGQLLTALHHNGRLCPHQGNVPPATAVFNGENIRDNSTVTRSGKHRVPAATPPGRGNETGPGHTEQHATLTTEAARNQLSRARRPSPTRRYSADGRRLNVPCALPPRAVPAFSLPGKWPEPTLASHLAAGSQAEGHDAERGRSGPCRDRGSLRAEPVI